MVSIDDPSGSRTWAFQRAILKIVRSSHIHEKSSDLDEIRYTNADLELGDSHVTKYENV